MRNIFAIGRRELSAYMTAPIGWIILCGFVLMFGFFFVVGLLQYDQAAADAVFNPYAADQINVNDMIVAPLFGNMLVIALLAAPALSMRLIAEDRRTRAIDLLLTSPVRSSEIVLGKFLGAIGFATVLVSTTFLYGAILMLLGEPDPGIMFANYVGFILLFGTFMATGLFASSLTENQVVALIVAFGLNLLLWIVGWTGGLMDEGALKSTVEYLSMLSHFEQLSKGVLRLQDIVYFLTFIGFFLFASTQRVEALRWR
ncbi:MAG: ABC transporter permease subunit [Pseudomonadota bacterium]|nr:ABC transporter permease subunit [Pseudomonadota bacterium]